MTDKKPIIGHKYILNNTKAIDLKKRQEVELELGHKYAIISNPYILEYYQPSFDPLFVPPCKVEMVAVNVLDDRSGQACAVEYHPDNLICEDSASKRPARAQDFISDATDFAKQFKVLQKTDKDMDGCSLVMFALKRRNGKTSGVMSVLGSMPDIMNNLVAALSENKQVCDMIERAAVMAQFENTFITK